MPPSANRTHRQQISASGLIPPIGSFQNIVRSMKSTPTMLPADSKIGTRTPLPKNTHRNPQIPPTALLVFSQSTTPSPPSPNMLVLRQKNCLVVDVGGCSFSFHFISFPLDRSLTHLLSIAPDPSSRTPHQLPVLLLSRIPFSCAERSEIVRI